jgi:pimeloyl-ACP methyl ester carboxylesterase
MDMMDVAVAARAGARLCVDDLGGGGVPLLLIHGLGGGKSSWEAAGRKLATGRRVLVPDLVGFGRSPWPDIDYSLDDHLDALEALIRERGIAGGPLDIAGHSMGAILAAELAARNPERVRRVALVSLPYFRSADEAKAWIGNLGVLARLTALGHWAAGAACALMCATRPVLSFLAPHFAPHVPAAVARDAVLHNFASYSRSLQRVVIHHRPDRALAALAGRPVLLVHGDQDRSAPLDNVRILAAGFPAWRLEVVSGADHHLPIDRPEPVARLLGSSTGAGAPVPLCE